MSTQRFLPDNGRPDDPFEIDTSVAHPARRYNYWLGGRDNFEADRISGDAIAATFPTIKTAALENRSFLRRAVTYLVEEAGVRQFLDIGTGIPSADNVHEVAQSVAPDTRVVYVDNDPIVLAHARRLLAGSPRGATAYVHADLREPNVIFGHPDLRRTLDLSQPVALMLIAVLHFFVDAADPYGHIARLVQALPPGSYFAATHATADFMPSAITDEVVETAVRRESARSRDPGTFRDRAAFERFFDGMTLVPPGIAPVSDWRNEVPPGERPSAADTMSYGAVARLP
ncbi:MAG TPA: SAM-dependent methyltransferase [Streptosporangiaceae bacterium]